MCKQTHYVPLKVRNSSIFLWHTLFGKVNGVVIHAMPDSQKRFTKITKHNIQQSCACINRLKSYFNPFYLVTVVDGLNFLLNKLPQVHICIAPVETSVKTACKASLQLQIHIIKRKIVRFWSAEPFRY